MRKYSNDYLNQLPLISNSNHRVYSDGQVFYKRSRDDRSASKIVLEAKVNEMLGRKSELLPGPPVSLVTERLGSPLTNKDLRESFVRESVRVMFDSHFLPRNKVEVIKNLVPSVNDMREEIEGKIKSRMSTKQNPEMLLNVLPVPLISSNYTLGLVHSDPRPANWLKKDDGTLVLIDWESAVAAPWEFAVVSFASYLYEYGRPDLVELVFEEADHVGNLSRNLMQWSANYRTAATASWYFANEDFDSGMNWVNKMSEMWLDHGF